MKKVFVFLFCFIFIGTAFATGENVPTSKSYADNALIPKQNVIERATGAAQVLTNTGTSGEYGTKNIYDASASYGGQSDALIYAQTMNAAVQNAIDSEFTCVDNDCTLFNVRGTNVQKSPNLFDISKVPTSQVVSGGITVNNGDGSLTVTAPANNAAVPTQMTLSYLAPEMIAGNRYTISFETTGRDKSIRLHCPCNTSESIYWNRNKSVVITDVLLNCKVFFYASGGGTSATISNIQITEGTTVQPYQPYGNVYVPSGNQ